jgi:glycosyltransferase involved in cell wall biosynthesis
MAAMVSYVGEGIPKDRIRVIPYGVDTESFKPVPPHERDLGRVLSVGALDPQKGHQHLVEGFHRIPGHKYSLELLGSTHNREFVSRLIQRDSRVRIRDTVQRAKMQAVIARSGVFALMSVQDGFGMVVVQAMACGIPVIVSDSVGAADIVTDGVDGFVIPVGDTDTLSVRLHELLAEPSLILEMGCRAREKVLALGGWTGYGLAYESACRSLLEDTGT